MLELRHISFSVNDSEEKEIVRDLSLTVENGKFVVITKLQMMVAGNLVQDEHCLML